MTNLLPLYSPNIKAKLVIDDSVGEDAGDGGRLHIPLPGVASGLSFVTKITIDSIDGHRLRWSLGGQHGAWRWEPGTYTETITAADGAFARIEYDPYTVAVVDLTSLAVNTIA